MESQENWNALWYYENQHGITNLELYWTSTDSLSYHWIQFYSDWEDRIENDSMFIHDKFKASDEWKAYWPNIK